LKFGVNELVLMKRAGYDEDVPFEAVQAPALLFKVVDGA
jgi:hypothetical protein